MRINISSRVLSLVYFLVDIVTAIFVMSKEPRNAAVIVGLCTTALAAIHISSVVVALAVVFNTVALVSGYILNDDSAVKSEDNVTVSHKTHNASYDSWTEECYICSEKITTDMEVRGLLTVCKGENSERRTIGLCKECTYTYATLTELDVSKKFDRRGEPEEVRKGRVHYCWL